MKKVLLFSGGMDSWLIDKLWYPDIKIYVDMGTDYGKEEIKKLPEDVKIVNFDLSQFEEKNEKRTIPMRNMFLLMIASMFGEEIALGSIDGDNVPDKTLKFADKADNLLNYLWQPYNEFVGKEIKVIFPFKYHTKTELLRKYLENGGNIYEAYNSSFSCFTPQNGDPCLNCQPCIRKVIAFINNGFHFSSEEKEGIIRYIEDNLLDKINEGYWHGREDEECLKALGILLWQ